MIAVTPIETQYAGCRFRSRLEARWAVFFDIMKLDWRYEPEGFTLPSGEWYLPDFFIPGIGYLEVKPTMEHARTESQWNALGGMLIECDDSGFILDRLGEVYCLYGDIPSPSQWGREGLPPDDERVGIWNSTDGDSSYWWARCPHCQTIGITYYGRYSRLRCCPQTCLDHDRSWNPHTAPFIVAAVAARSERF